jgi:hypothetical protein
MKGVVYSTNKERLKGLMKSHGLAWIGTQYNAIWKGPNGEMKATFDRSNGVTQEATLTYSGPDNDFIRLFTSFICNLGAQYTDESVQAETADIDKIIAVEMRIWDACNRPNVEMMRKGEGSRRPPAPQRFIELAIKDYNEKRLIQVQKVRDQVMKDYGLTDKKVERNNMTDEEQEEQDIDDILGN